MQQFSSQLTKQFDQMIDVGNLWRAQIETAVGFWMGQGVEASKEAQKLTKEWMGASWSVTDEVVKVAQGHVQEAMKVLTPAS
jgi:hypothetical protein